MRPLVGTGSTSWIRPLNSPLASSSEMSPPRARSRSTADPDRRWPVATGTARASTVMSAGAVATRLIFTRLLTLPSRWRQALGDELKHVGDTKLDAAAAGGAGNVDEAPGVVGRHDRAAGFGYGVELPFGEAAGHPRPIKAEGAAEPAAVGDVGDVHHLVARQAKQPPRLGFEAELPQGLAGVVIGDLETRASLANELRLLRQQVERETGRIPEPGAERVLGGSTPFRRVDGEGAEARGRRRHDQTLGISKALGQAVMELGPP